MSSPTRWCVAKTKPQAERWAQFNLMRQGYTVYLPLCAVRRRDRVLRSLIRTVEVPLFATYLFVQHMPGTSWRAMRGTLGVSSIVCSGGEIRYARDGDVEALMATEALRRTPASSSLHVGAPCRLLTGPLRNNDAVVLDVSGKTADVAVLLFGELRRIVVPLDALNPRED
jgi:transcription antitermination factor NusG